jgi:repressor LexA
VVDRLIEAKLIQKEGRTLKLVGVHSIQSISTINVPLVGSVACGVPLFAEENIETLIPVSTALARAGSKYFILRAKGTSMNDAGIDDGDLLLVRQQDTADDKQKVVALINDEATVKILEKGNGVVILRPKSKDKSHKPIILTDNCMIQGVVVAVLPADLH